MYLTNHGKQSAVKEIVVLSYPDGERAVFDGRNGAEPHILRV
jgi:hypothetical protein